MKYFIKYDHVFVNSRRQRIWEWGVHCPRRLHPLRRLRQARLLHHRNGAAKVKILNWLFWKKKLFTYLTNTPTFSLLLFFSCNKSTQLGWTSCLRVATDSILVDIRISLTLYFMLRTNNSFYSQRIKTQLWCCLLIICLDWYDYKTQL